MGGVPHIAYKIVWTEEVIQLYSKAWDSAELQQVEFVWGTTLKIKGEYCQRGIMRRSILPKKWLLKECMIKINWVQVYGNIYSV